MDFQRYYNGVGLIVENKINNSFSTCPLCGEMKVDWEIVFDFKGDLICVLAKMSALRWRNQDHFQRQQRRNAVLVHSVGHRRNQSQRPCSRRQLHVALHESRCEIAKRLGDSISTNRLGR